MSLEYSSAAANSFRYFESDFTPMLQPSVINSAAALSDFSVTSLKLAFMPPIISAIIGGDLPSSLKRSRRSLISLPISRCWARLCSSTFFKGSLSLNSSTSSIDEMPILTPASHSLKSLMVSFSIMVIYLLYQSIGILLAQ